MVLADSGFWLALANSRDHWHRAAVSAVENLADTLLVTWPVVTETCHLLLTRLGLQPQLRFLEQLSENIEIHEITVDRLPAIRALMEKYSNLPMDLADASLVLAAADIGDGRILSTDKRDFDTYRWKNTEPFLNLLRE